MNADEPPQLTFIHVVCADIFDPTVLFAPCLILKLPVVNVAVAFCNVLNTAVVVFALPASPVYDQFQSSGDPVDVSLNTIVNGATPAQPCDVLFVADEMFRELKLATGGVDVAAELTFTHVTCSEMFEPNEFVAFSLMV